MASGTDPFKSITGGAAKKAGRINFIAGAAGIIASLILDNPTALALAAGFVVGSIDILWLLHIARQGLHIESQKSARSVVIGYYLRFGATVAAFAILISKRIISPWPLIVGFTLALFSVIGVMIYAAREEMFKDA
ncbi:MAG: ATP synthase subunit I [Deltaproteobacteria bacterium]|nr:ATP synthase subunit I [Deltaproteobacteria bacterium]